jgi:DNA-binding response OmpR family regulator
MSEKPVGLQTDGVTVLIVEDDRNTAALVATYLEREGFRTVAAHDGQQALEMVRRYRPGFVVLDIMLPKIDGWEVCRQPERKRSTGWQGFRWEQMIM